MLVPETCGVVVAVWGLTDLGLRPAIPVEEVAVADRLVLWPCQEVHSLFGCQLYETLNYRMLQFPKMCLPVHEQVHQSLLLLKSPLLPGPEETAPGFSCLTQ